MFSLPTGLPEHNDLEQLKRQAKELLKAHDAGDPLARELTARHFPGGGEGGLQLAGAQLVVARHHGFDSWAQLRAHVDRVNLQRLLRAVERGDTREARDLLRRRPELVAMDMAGNDERRVLHYAVLKRDEPMVRLLMEAGADAHQGVYPHRDATTAYLFAQERGFADITAAIEEEERFRREKMSCPNATVSPAQDELAACIRKGNHAAAIAMLEAAPDLARACDREGGTPLHVACEENALPVIDWLLEHHANPRKEDIKGRTPLERAVARVGWKTRDRRHAVPGIAQRLLRHGAPTSPMVAAALGDLDALRRIHENEPKALIGGIWNEPNVLSTAVVFSRIDAVKLLLNLGLDPNERVRLRNVEEEVLSHGHPLWLAAAFGDYDIASLLLERGADPNAMVHASGNPVDRAYGARDEKMKELLASHGGHPTPGTIGMNRETAAAQRLIDSGCNEQDLRDLLWAGACGGSVEIVRMTLPFMPWPPDHESWHSVMIQPLRIHLHSPVGEHPECFDRSTYPECLRLILDHGMNINLTGKHGDTLMHCIAAEGKCWGIVVMTEEERLAFARIALAHSPDLSIRDKLLKSTPLAWACRWGRVELVKLLLDHGVPVEEPDAEPWATPLAWARKSHQRAISTLLEEKGAAR